MWANSSPEGLRDSVLPASNKCARLHLSMRTIMGRFAAAVRSESTMAAAPPGNTFKTEKKPGKCIIAAVPLHLLGASFLPCSRLSGLKVLRHLHPECIASQISQTTSIGVQQKLPLSQDDHPPLPLDITPDMQNFLLQCFQKDPAKRPGAAMLLSHRWVQYNRATLRTSWSRTKGLKARGVKTDAHIAVSAAVELMLQVMQTLF